MVRHASWSRFDLWGDESAPLPVLDCLPLQSNEHVADAPLLGGTYLRGLDIQSGPGNLCHRDAAAPDQECGNFLLPRVDFEAAFLLGFHVVALEVLVGPPFLAGPISADRFCEE